MQFLSHKTQRHTSRQDGQITTPSPILEEQVPSGWPTIDGIDSQVACEQLGGNRSLLLLTLKRLFDDASHIGVPLGSLIGAEKLGTLASRVHKFRSIASLLGAKAIYSLASDVEVACRTHKTDHATAILAALILQIEALRQVAEPVLLQAQAEEDATEPIVDDCFDLERLAVLQGLLDQQDLGALELFAELSGCLRHFLGQDMFACMRAQINNLQFSDAAKALHELRGRLTQL